MSKLFLDDVRKPYDDTWDVVRDYDEFVSYILTSGVPEIISFDHDLDVTHYAINGYTGPQVAKDGYDCAKWLDIYLRTVDKSIRKKLLKGVRVHSWNPDGARRIANVFRDLEIPTEIKEY